MIDDILNSENLFLILLGLIWIIGAVLQDLKRREVDNLWNFSLIAFALAYRLGVSVYTGNYMFILNGILGFVLFLMLGNLFYYSRIFAGGDAKLMISLGTILPLGYDWIVNFKIFGIFILLFLLTGSVYVLIWSFILVFKHFKHFKKEFIIYFKKYKRMFYFGVLFFILWILIGFFLKSFLLGFIGFIILLFPILLIFAKAVEESCMIKSMSASEITEGDWLYKDIVVGGKKIKATWDGLSKSDISLIRKEYRKKILIKQGIPFTPGFLFGFLLLLYFILKFKWIF